MIIWTTLSKLIIKEVFCGRIKSDNFSSEGVLKKYGRFTPYFLA